MFYWKYIEDYCGLWFSSCSCLFSFFFFSFFLFKESFLRNPSVTHENCLAAFCPTVYGQNQVKKRSYHHSVSHMIMGRERKDKLSMPFFSFLVEKKVCLLYIYTHIYIYIYIHIHTYIYLYIFYEDNKKNKNKFHGLK